MTGQDSRIAPSAVAAHLWWCLARVDEQARLVDVVASRTQNFTRMVDAFEELNRIRAARDDKVIRELRRRCRKLATAAKSAASKEPGFEFVRLPFGKGRGSPAHERGVLGLNDARACDLAKPYDKGRQNDE